MVNFGDGYPWASMKGRLAGEPTQIRKKKIKKTKKKRKKKNDTLPQQYIHIYGCIVGDDMLVLVFQNSNEQIRVEK